MLLIVVVACLAGPAVAAAESCYGFMPSNFDPKTVTTIESGQTWGFPSYRSPEHSDPALVYHVGDPSTSDGCVGGIESSLLGPSGVPTGVLEIVDCSAYCLGFDIQSESPVLVEAFDRAGNLYLSFNSTSRADIVSRDHYSDIGRVRITPGTDASGRVAMCIDELTVVAPPLPVAKSSWGGLKITYR